MRSVALGVCIVAALTRPAAAETVAELFQQGLKLIDAGKPAEACAKLEAALAIEPEKPGVMLNLGVCNAKQNRTATALAWFRRALTRAAERNMAETENVARVQIKRLSAIVPTVKLVVGGDGATVLLDGLPVMATSFARLEIDPGTHTFEVRAPGRQSITRTIDVENKPDARQVVTLDVGPPVNERVDPPPVEPKLVEVDRGAGRRRGALIGGAVGGGLMLAAGGVSLLARLRFDASDDLDTRKRWKNIAHYGGTSMFIGGAATVAVCAVLYLSAPGKERVPATAVAPIVDGGTIGLAIGGPL